MRRFQSVLMIVLIIGISAGTYSCKSKKKLAAQEAAAAKARKIAKAKADLEELLSDRSTLTLDEKEKKLQVIKDMNIDDPEVKELIGQVEQKLAREREAQAAKERAEKLRREREERLKAEGSENKSLSDYFSAISSSNNLATSNRLIEEALQLFASDDVPVLIIISQAGKEKDYDRPTTIRKYLEYLKDQKVNRNAIENVVYDANGKITELELIKKY
jgi:hypothetical protein